MDEHPRGLPPPDPKSGFNFTFEASEGSYWRYFEASPIAIPSFFLFFFLLVLHCSYLHTYTTLNIMLLASIVVLRTDFSLCCLVVCLLASLSGQLSSSQVAEHLQRLCLMQATVMAQICQNLDCAERTALQQVFGPATEGLMKLLGMRYYGLANFGLESLGYKDHWCHITIKMTH